MRRLTAVAFLSLSVPALLALPVVSRALPSAHAVAPVVREIPLAGAGAFSARAPRVTTATGRFSLVGVTWAADPRVGEPTVEVRVRQSHRWGDWQHLHASDEHGPDDGHESAAARGGTDPLYVGDSDAAQVRLAAAPGVRPRDVRLTLVDPGRSAADGAIGKAPTLGGSAAEAATPRPTIVSRAQWGADERIRKGTPDYASTVLMGFVHHTDSSNTYSAAQAASVIRGVYAFHVQGRGWSDIGYNFLVDRFGRIYEGRYGGIDKAVIGAHTGGFNTKSFGVALVGNYTSTVPGSAQRAALERILGWKLGLTYRNPYGTTVLTSAGGSKYAKGTNVRFNNISGHRDGGLTACPGNQVYAQLPSIRSFVKTRMGASLYDPSVSTATPMYLSGTKVTVRAGVPGSQNWALRVSDAVTGVPLREWKGVATSTIAVTWDLRGPDGLLLPPGTYKVKLDAANATGNVAVPYITTIEVRSPLASGMTVRDVKTGKTKLLLGGRQHSPSAALLAALRPQLKPVTAYPTQLTPFHSPVGLPRDGALLKDAKGALWAVVGGERRAVSAAVAKSLGYSASAAPTVTDSVLRLVPIGSALRDVTRHPDGQLITSGTTAWRLEHGMRRPLTSAAARATWAKGRVTSAALAGDLALPPGPALGPAEGTVLRISGGAGVVSGGAFRRFASAAVATALTYATASAPVATGADLAALPAGEQITATNRHPTGTIVIKGGHWELVGAGRLPLSPELVKLDHRKPVVEVSGELSKIAMVAMPAPAGLAGRDAAGVIRVVVDGRLVTLDTDTAHRLGYDVATLPALAQADFAAPVLAAGLAAPLRHPQGSLVGDGSSVWLVTSGERRLLAPSLVPTWTSRPVLAATEADLALPLGATAPPMPGSWLTSDDGARWLVEDGVRRAVSATTARRLGLHAVSPRAVLLADLKTGTVLGAVVP